MAVAALVACDQHGVVSHAQLVAAGVSRCAIARAVRDGRLVRIHHGVYAIGHRALRPEAFWLAAVLTGGPGAVLSHRSGAAAWELCADSSTRVDITVTGERRHVRRGVRIHRCRLHPDDVTVHRGVPVTTPMRSLLDFAEVTDERGLQRAVEASERLGLFDGFAMTALLERSRGRRGLKPLRRALAQFDDSHALSRSELESLAIAVADRHGIPRPLVNARMGDYEIDLFWPGDRVVVEADSWTFHGTRGAFERDRRRDLDLEAVGHHVLRLTWRQLKHEPEIVASRLAAVLAAKGAE